MVDAPIRVLLVEDSDDDALLVLHELERAGYQPVHQRVDTAADLVSALTSQEWDIVLSDFSMGEFTGSEAFDIVRGHGLDIPFIFVSGHIGEERAVEAMKKGANDYVLKDNRLRLIPAIQRELRDLAVRRQRIQADAALRESEERYRDLVEGSIQGILIVQKGKIVYCNQSLARIFGYLSPEELVGTEAIEIVHPGDRHDALLTGSKELREGRAEFRRYYRGVKKDGSTIWYEPFQAMTTWHGHRAVQWTLLDDTQRKIAEEELRKSERKFRNLVQASIQGVSVISDYKLVFANPAYAQMHGFADVNELMGSAGWLSLIAEEDQGRMEVLHYLRLAGQGGSARYERQAVRKDGSRIWLDVSTAVVEWEGQSAWLATMVDITERKRAEEELRANQRLLRTVFDTIPHHLIVKDLESRYLIVNKAWCEAFGYNPEDVANRSSLELSRRPAQELARILEEDRRVFAGESIVTPMSRTLTVKSGEQRFFQGIKTPLRDEAGAAVGLVGIAMDVTAEVQSQQKADTAHARLVDAIESLPAAFCMFDPEERLVLWNSRNQEFFPDLFDKLHEGMAFQEMMGIVAETAIVLPGGNAEMWLRERIDQFRNNPGPSEERLKDGRWVQGLDRRTSDGGSVTLRFDISEIKQREQEARGAELARQASEERLSLIYRTMSEPVALMAIEPGGRFRWISVNSAFEKFTGLKREQAEGAFLDGHLPQELYTSVTSRYRRVVESAASIQEEQVVTLADGVHTLMVMVSPVLDGAGHCTHVLSSWLDITDRKKAEEDLRESQRLLNTVFDALPVNLVVKDRETRYLMVNPSWCERYGVTPGQVLGKRSMDIPGRSEADKRFTHEQDLKTLASDSRTLVFEGWDRTASGEIRHYQSIRAPIRDENGTVTGMVGASVDLTELKRAEQRLLANERLLQTVFDTNPHMIVVQNAAGRLLTVNKAWSEAYGIAPEQALDKRINDLTDIPEAERRSFAEEDELVLSGTLSKVASERVFTVKNGERRFVYSVKRPFVNEKGEIAGLVGVFVDQTDLREARSKADLASARLLDAVECIPASFFMYGADERLILWNSRARELMPRQYHDIHQGMTFEEMLRLEAQSDVVEAEGRTEAWIQERLQQMRNNPDKFETTLSDGRSFQAYDFRISDGGTVCLRFDITPMKKQEMDLRQAQKMEALGHLTGGVAHDFNNLLQIILTYTDFAMEGLPESDGRLADLGAVRAAGERAAELTQQLLAFSRKQVLKKTNVSLNEVVQGVAKLLARALRDDIELSVRTDDHAAPVFADRGMMEQVIMNLAVNARDAMPKGGRMLIRTDTAELDEEHCRDRSWARPGKYSVLHVTDTGAGMSQDVRDRIFEPFFTTKPSGKGTGLGLSTVFGIVQQHGGLIDLDTELGRGSTFSIYWPAVDEGSLLGGTPAHEPVRGGTETLLVAEDEERVRALTLRTLERAGYRVLAAADGLQALEIYVREHSGIDLVVLDMLMPRLGGAECFARMREIDPALRVVFCSGWYSDEEETHLLEQEAIVVHKPHAPDELLRAVRKVLDGRDPGKGDGRGGA